MATHKGGLRQQGGIWHIDKREKRVAGGRLRESTGTSDRAEAEVYLARRLEEIRQAAVYGVRPGRTWREAAIRYLDEHNHKRSIARDAQDLRALDPYIGDLPLVKVHAGTLQPFINERKKAGIKSGTVNRSLAVARRILRLAAELWRDEYGLTWLETAPMIPTVDWQDKRPPAPLTWAEQARLFSALPETTRDRAEFAVHTGCREMEVCQLEWSWEVELPGGNFGFILPGEITKNGRERLVVLNTTARAVVNRQRGKHPDRVFTYRGKPVESIMNNSFTRARESVGLPQVRVHDLRHTFGRRLRAAGVPAETRAELLGHATGSITTHYSATEVQELINAVELIAEKRGAEADGVAVVKLRPVHKTPTAEKRKAAE